MPGDEFSLRHDELFCREDHHGGGGGGGGGTGTKKKKEEEEEEEENGQEENNNNNNNNHEDGEDARPASSASLVGVAGALGALGAVGGGGGGGGGGSDGVAVTGEDEDVDDGEMMKQKDAKDAKVSLKFVRLRRLCCPIASVARVDTLRPPSERGQLHTTSDEKYPLRKRLEAKRKCFLGEGEGKEITGKFLFSVRYSKTLFSPLFFHISVGLQLFKKQLGRNKSSCSTSPKWLAPSFFSFDSVPNRQRTLDRLPPELRRRNFA